MSQRKPAEPWVPRDFIVLTHGGKKIRVRADKKPALDTAGAYDAPHGLKIGESRFYSVAAILDPDNAEIL